jgi:CO/xanthine dehydrogenase Mo-binding subunit
MAAIANAIRGAKGLRMPDLPISPPKLGAPLESAG